MLENLTTEQAHQVTRFLLHQMGSATRSELMLALPQAYVTLYPNARQAVLTRQQESLSNGQQDERDGS